jgi:homoserine kinase
MALVDALRAAGHAAVISGAGPSVLVLATLDRADEVAACVGDHWRVLRPGVPARGAEVEWANVG